MRPYRAPTIPTPSAAFALLALCAAMPFHALAAQNGAHHVVHDSATTATAAAIEDAGFTPVFHAMVFGDASYVATDRKIAQGFLLGQAVGHVVASLTERLAYFGEVTVSAQANAYAIEIERSILRYDFVDELKLSGGRYHTPIGYWNTAYHHGTWLQTTVARPEYVKYGSVFVPTHFVGAMAEGNVPAGPIGLGYMVGVGNGRGGTISRASDAGDLNGSRAWTAALSARPSSLFGLQLGGGYYADRVSPTVGRQATEGIASAYVAWQSETPELIAEYVNVRHTPTDSGATTTNHAAYAQLAYRLPGAGRRWKPYVRVEELVTAARDVVFAPLSLGYRGGIGGVRFDFAPYAALKAEYRREHFQGREWSNGGYLNVSFTLPDLGGADANRGAH